MDYMFFYIFFVINKITNILLKVKILNWHSGCFDFSLFKTQ
jgi:hypothetical protein